MEKLSFPLHIPNVTHTPSAVPAMGLTGEFTTFMVLSSFITLRPKRLASFFEIKLCVAPVSSKAHTA